MLFIDIVARILFLAMEITFENCKMGFSTCGFQNTGLMPCFGLLYSCYWWSLASALAIVPMSAVEGIASGQAWAWECGNDDTSRFVMSSLTLSALVLCVMLWCSPLPIAGLWRSASGLSSPLSCYPTNIDIERIKVFLDKSEYWIFKSKEVHQKSWRK